MDDVNVAATTININGLSVHSRHIMVGDSKILPSQYYGSCKCISR